MNDKIVTTTIEILGKVYPIRCGEQEVSSLQSAATLLNQKMAEVQESGKVINLERIAIITALNMAHLLLQSDNQKSFAMQKINQRLLQLQHKVDAVMQDIVETESIYSAE